MRILIAAVLVTVLGGLGTVYAAQGANPGDSLYGLKTAVERTGLGLPGAGTNNRANDQQNGNAQNAGTNNGDPSASSQSHRKSTDVVSGTIGITLTQTISDVAALENDSQVAGQSENGLGAKLDAANGALERSQPAVAVNQFDAFLHQLNASCRSGHVTQRNYDKLYDDYNALVTGAGGTAEAKLDSCKSAPGPTVTPGQGTTGNSADHRPASAGVAPGNAGGR